MLKGLRRESEVAVNPNVARCVMEALLLIGLFLTFAEIGGGKAGW